MPRTGNAPAAPAHPAEESVATEMYKTLHAKVKLIRDRHGCTIPEAIQKFGGPGIDKEYRRLLREMTAEAELGGEG